MKIAVIGGGPVGIFAAWASLQYGHKVTVYDRNPSLLSEGKNHGVFALWDSCDLFLSQKKLVHCGVIGGKGKKAEAIEMAYAFKVYGDFTQPTSVSKYMHYDYLECYNHAEAYQQIIDILGRDNIQEKKIQNLQDVLNLLDNYDLVINTLPANLLWPSLEWPFTVAYIYHSQAPESDSFMIYNVNEFISWYRCSAIFGKFSMEYSKLPDNDKSYVKVIKVMEPPQHPDDLTPKEVWNVGRFGGWNKEQLTEDVYWEVCRRLNDLNLIRPSGQYVSISSNSAKELDGYSLSH